jgi:hypothetical protein
MKSLEELNLRGNKIGKIGYGILHDSAIKQIDLTENKHKLRLGFLQAFRDSPGLRQRQRPPSPEPDAPQTPPPVLHAFRRAEEALEDEGIKAQMELEEQQMELENEILREEWKRKNAPGDSLTLV